MKKALFIAVIISFSVCVARAQAVVSLSGKVTDSASGQPLAGCSVFFSSTSIGTISLADGSFHLKGPSSGRFELIVSFVGYNTFVLPIKGDSLPEGLSIRLRQKPSELSAYTVEAYLKNGWKVWGKLFTDYFIGTTENASSCKLLNRKALRFHYSRKNHRLTVTATEPLIIRNKALGYNLQYQLQLFSYDERTHVVFYEGYSLFTEMSADEDTRRRWVKRRENAYLGSMRHFIQSLFVDSLSEQGFFPEYVMQADNPEKQRVRRVYDPNGPIGRYGTDTLYYYWRVLKGPDVIDKRVAADPHGLVNILPGGHKQLVFKGVLFVKYYIDPASPYDYVQSNLRLLTLAGVEIEANGTYFPPQDMLAEGTWSQTEKICNLLPLDYPMPALESPGLP